MTLNLRRAVTKGVSLSAAVTLFVAALVSSFVSVSYPALAAPKAARKGASTDAVLKSLVDTRRSQMEKEIQDKAREVLSSQFESRQYLVNVVTEIDYARLKKAALRAAAGSSSAMAPQMSQREQFETFIDAMPKEVFREFTKGITLKVYVDNSIPKALVDALSDVLVRQTGLHPEKGDKLVLSRELEGLGGGQKAQAKVEQLTQDFNKAQDEKRSLESKVQSLENALRAADSQKQGLESQRAQLESQKIQLETQNKLTDSQRVAFQQQLQQLADDLSKERAAKKAIEDKIKGVKGAEEEKGFLPKVRHIFQGAELPLTLIPIAILLGIIAIIITFLNSASSNKRTRNLAQGLQLLANALQKSGVGGGGVKEAAKLFKAEAGEKSANNANTGATAGGAQGGGGELLEMARSEALAAWNLIQTRKSYAYGLMKDWLLDTQNNGAVRFVTLLDAIGLEQAGEIWELFPTEELEILKAKQPRPLPKDLGFASVIELYRGIEAELAALPPFFAGLDSLALIKLSDNSLAELFGEMELETAAAGFLFVTRARAARVLPLLQNHTAEDLVSAMAQLRDMNEDDANRHLSALCARAEEIVPPRNIDVASLVAGLIESADLSLRERLTAALSSDADLAAAVRAKIVLFEDVLKLDRDILSELFQDYEAEDLASLMLTLQAAGQQVIGSFFSQRMAFSVREEMNRASAKPTALKRAQARGERVQLEIVSQVKAMVEDGSVDLKGTSAQANPTGGNRQNSEGRRAS